MEDNVVVKTAIEMPLRHQLGKVMIATLAAFAASELVKKGYDAAYKAMEARKAA